MSNTGFGPGPVLSWSCSIYVINPGPVCVLVLRFGDGYVVTMKVRAAGPGSSPDLRPAEGFMESNFSKCVQREKHFNTLQYEVTSSSLARVFQLVAENKHKLNIEDYSVSQTTLDQVKKSQTLDQEIYRTTLSVLQNSLTKILNNTQDKDVCQGMMFKKHV